MGRKGYMFLIVVIVSIFGSSRMAIGHMGNAYESHRMGSEMKEESCMKGSDMMKHKMGEPMMKEGMGMGMRMGTDMPKMYPWGYLKESLKLTEEQDKKLGKVYSDYRKEMLKKKVDVEIAEMELTELLKTKEADVTAIEESANRLESLRSDLNMARVKALLKTREFLSDEQYEDLSGFILEWMRGWRRPHQMGGAGHECMDEMMECR